MDKVQKIRQEVEKLKSNLVYGACASQVAMETRCKEEAYDEVLAILDNTQEQHKETNFLDELKTKLDSMSKEEFEQVWEKYRVEEEEEPVSKEKLSNVQRYVKNWKEPVSVELEKEIEKYMNALYRYWTEDERLKDSDVEELCKQTARHFTNWQKQKDSIVSDGLEEASKEWLKPQLDKSYAEYGEVKMMELTHFDGYAMLDAIEFGAKWQREQDQSTIELAEDHAIAGWIDNEFIDNFRKVMRNEIQD